MTVNPARGLVSCRHQSDEKNKVFVMPTPGFKIHVPILYAKTARMYQYQLQNMSYLMN